MTPGVRNATLDVMSATSSAASRLLLLGGFARTAARVVLVPLALAVPACDAPAPVADAGREAGSPTRDAAPDSDADATVAADAPSVDAPPVEAGDTSVAFDGHGGVGNGTCAETASYCTAHEQCCSGLCATASPGGGTCALPTADGGSRPTWPVPDGGAACLHPCACRSNQHCCLVLAASTACGLTQQCSVLEGCQ